VAAQWLYGWNRTKLILRYVWGVSVALSGYGANSRYEGWPTGLIISSVRR
jgi:hypothetical protein